MPFLALLVVELQHILHTHKTFIPLIIYHCPLCHKMSYIKKVTSSYTSVCQRDTNRQRRTGANTLFHVY